ncbi:hypothetical protein F4780DRAFT_582739 [Xylariomycetidae sp. FL0641]|nr:hypothetical protein F4780DRAFT_582739 [Xylariomycetidae sp. FL0641]
MSFLHERSLVQRHQDGTLEETLAYTVCATSAMRLRQGKYHPLNTEGWVQQAEDIIWSQIEQPTIFRLQALILAIHYRIATGRFQRAFMLASLAARFASALRLNYEREDLGFLAQEIRRRLMWTLMTMDTFFSVGLPEFELCPYETIYLKLPSNEDDFNADFSQTTQSEAPGSVSVGSDTGLYAFAIRLTTLRRDVMRLKRQVTLSERPIPQLVKLVEDFRKSLLRVRSETPGSRLYALGEMEKFYSSRWRQRYLVAHLSWHQCNCDLYRLFLKGYPEAASNNVLQAVDPAYMSTAASLCLEHATSIIQIIYDFNQRSSDDEIVEHDVAVCAYHAARIVAYTANPEWDPQQSLREAVLGQATLCLAFLRRFFSDSPLVTYMITDLEKIIRGSSGTGDRSGSAESSESEENGVGHIPRLSRVARDTQRLGVHSVVRQSRFVDDSGECTTPTTTPGTAPFRRQFSSPGASTVSDRMAQPSLVPGQGSISHATAFPTGNQWDPSWSIGLDLLGDGFESHNIDFGLDRAWSNLQPSWPGNGPAADPEFF